MDLFKIILVLFFTVVLVGSCSYDKENIKISPSDRKSNSYPISCDYNYTGIDSGQNTATKRCR